MAIIKNNMKRRNLISKRTGIGDHMIYDWVTKKWLPNANPYIDVVHIDDVTGEEELGNCIKNQYREIDWIKNLIRTPYWKSVGKERSLYEYFIDCDDCRKPNEKHGYTEADLYRIASGDMQFDFDDITDEQIEDIKQSFIECSKRNPTYHWFEYSWSRHGCHIRIYANLKMKTKIEWGFWYIHLLNGILKHLSDKHRDEIIKHIDWSCATVTRGFAIPYNEGGVLMGETYNEQNIIGIENEDELEKIFQKYNYEWYDKLFDYFMKKFVNPKKKKELQQLGLISENKGYKYSYTMYGDWIMNENHPLVDGEIYNYNWRLSLVTTLMGVFNKDKEIVRNICAVIYKYIKPYKNHNYNEMLYDELEHKIFNRANFDLEPSHEILKELWNNWGLKIEIRPNIK